MSNRKWKGNNRKVYFIGSIIIILLIFVVGIFSMIFYNSLKRTAFKEKKEHLIDINKKSILVVDELVDASWDRLHICEILLLNSPPSSEKELFRCLESMFGYMDESDILTIAVDNEGNYYTSKGGKAVFNKPEMLEIKNKNKNHQSTIMNLKLYGDEDEYSLVLLDKIDKTDQVLKCGDVSIEYIGLAVDLKAISDTFTIDDLKNDSVIYLLDQSGKRLYGNYGTNIIEKENVLEGINDFKFIQGGKYKDFKRDLKNKKNNVYQVKYKGQEYYAFISYVDAADWYMVMLVPCDMIGNNAANVLRSSIWYIFMITILIAIICVVVIKMIITERSAVSANNAKSEFLAHMSHDIRTPINAIMCMTDIALKNKNDSNKMVYCLDKIDESSNHLLNLVNDVLDLSRIESGKTNIVCEPINIKEVCEYSSSVISGQLLLRKLEFYKSFDEFEYPNVFGDALHLRQVLINILGNSIKFTPDGGRIDFRVSQTVRNENEVIFHFEIEDTGIGMKEDFLPHIFDNFAQEYDATTVGNSGTGLGMAISKKFVEMMKGKIFVQSTYQVGTKISIDIPYRINKNVVDEPEKTEKIKLEDMNILVVDDNELNLEIAIMEFEEEKAVVTVARNGKQALETLYNSKPYTYDVILMDIMMPVMNGYEAARRIRSCDREDLREIPIIAFSANVYGNKVKEAERAGMNAFIAKPINPEEVKRVLTSYRNKKYNKENINSLRNKRILIVDDMEINALIEREYLEENEVLVSVASNGRVAVEIFEESDIDYFDVILMDINMPVLDGYEAAKIIRSLDRKDAKKVLIFAMTADVCQDKEKMKKAGINDGLIKPLEIEALAAMLEKYK